jgi:hypothetical protein
MYIRQFAYANLIIITISSLISISSCEDDIVQNTPVSALDNTYTFYTKWYDSSVPELLSQKTNLWNFDMMKYKARACWFNILPSNVTPSDILPDQLPINYYVHTLSIYYDPSLRGSYNSEPMLDNRENNWGGLTALLTLDDMDLIYENFYSTNIYMWIYLAYGGEDKFVYVDIGAISEDIIPNGIYNSEDLNCNELIDEGEDTGLDGLLNHNEPGYDPDENYDPNGDDFSLVPNPQYLDFSNYLRINDPEGNAFFSDKARIPDTEDINHNFQLDAGNAYYTYKIPLSLNNNEYIYEKGESENWVKLKIPLNLYSEITNLPSHAAIDKMRIWFTGLDEEIYIQIAEIKFSKE